MAKLNWGGANQQSQSQAGAEADADVSMNLEPERDQQRTRPKAQKRDSFLVRFKEKWSSPGRGELQRSERSDAISKRTKERRDARLQRKVSKRRRHSVSDSEEDHHSQRNRSPRKVSGMRNHSPEQDSNKPHWVSNLFTFIAQHPTVPHILSFYAQLAFNVFLLAACAYMLYCFWSAVQGDIDKKAFEAMAEVMAESAQCLHSWESNKCDRATRVPALEKVCEGWEACMNRDATKIGRARVSAHTFAEIFNSFVEPISWKAMASLAQEHCPKHHANIHSRSSPYSLSLGVSQQQTWHSATLEKRPNISNIIHHHINTFHRLLHSVAFRDSPWRAIMGLLGSNIHKVLWNLSRVR